MAGSSLAAAAADGAVEADWFSMRSRNTFVNNPA
jgi:hypothetical protein